MHLGIGTYSFPWAAGAGGGETPEFFSSSDLLAFAARRGIGFVQFGDNYPLHLLPEKELSTLKKTAEEKSIQIEVGTRGLTVPNITRYLSIASFFNADFLRAIIDDDGFHPDAPHVIETLKSLLPQLKASNVRLAIENHDRFPAQSLQQILQESDPEWRAI